MVYLTLFTIFSPVLIVPLFLVLMAVTSGSGNARRFVVAYYPVTALALCYALAMVMSDRLETGALVFMAVWFVEVVLTVFVYYPVLLIRYLRSRGRKVSNNS